MDSTTSIFNEAAAAFPRIVELRRDIHRHPELAFEERRTAQVIVQELQRLGIENNYAGVGRSVIGHIPGSGKSRVRVALRAEMDALPGDENTGLPFSSEIPGRMHACGHDAHVATLLGAAALLKHHRPRGDVVLVFQPAEERGSGALTAIEDGALKDVDYIFAGHVTHQYSTGEIMVAEGTITAQSDRFRIHIKGEGGHGARPHEATDAVVIAGSLISTIQTLISREINPLHPSVVTIGKIRAGSAGNVIADEAVLEGTIRTTLPEVREHIHQGLQRMGEATAILHDAHVEVSIAAGNPPVVNSPVAAAIALRAAGQLVEETALPRMDYPSMGSEDFSHYLKHVAGCYVRFGARKPDWEPVPLHSPVFDVDEDYMKLAATFFVTVVEEAQQTIQ